MIGMRLQLLLLLLLLLCRAASHGFLYLGSGVIPVVEFVYYYNG